LKPTGAAGPPTSSVVHLEKSPGTFALVYFHPGCMLIANMLSVTPSYLFVAREKIRASLFCISWHKTSFFLLLWVGPDTIQSNRFIEGKIIIELISVPLYHLSICISWHRNFVFFTSGCTRYNTSKQVYKIKNHDTIDIRQQYSDWNHV
jgi:hypothetical protein